MRVLAPSHSRYMCSSAVSCLSWLVALLLVALGACDMPDRFSNAAPSPADTLETLRDTVEQQVSIDEMTDGGEIEMPHIWRRSVLREDSLWEKALRIHYNAIVLDGHVDTPTLMLDEGYNLTERNRARGHVDLPRMRYGGLDGAFFSIYVAASYGEGAEATARARAMMAETKRQVRRRADEAELATTADEVRRIARDGKRAVLLGLEGGHALTGSLDTLRAFYADGIRYVTLTHVNTHSWADASQSLPRHGGLTDFGRDMVREMNRLGMLVDLSHVSDETFYDALETSRAPVILSHSSARALSPNVRNVDDDMLRALAGNDGVIMINFFDPVVNPHLDADFMAEVRRRMNERGESLRNLWPVVYELRRERSIPSATLDDVLDHIDHVVDVAGIEHVGLGSDFDGVFDLPTGLEDVSRLPWLTYGLLQRGYSEPEIYRILGGNTLRVLEEVEAFSRTQNESASFSTAQPPDSTVRH